jgi:hypothetical protein
MPEPPDIASIRAYVTAHPRDVQAKDVLDMLDVVATMRADVARSERQAVLATQKLKVAELRIAELEVERQKLIANGKRQAAAADKFETWWREQRNGKSLAEARIARASAICDERGYSPETEAALAVVRRVLSEVPDA